MPTGLLVRCQETRAQRDRVVWHLGLATYMEHGELRRQLKEVLEVLYLLISKSPEAVSWGIVQREFLELFVGSALTVEANPG